MKILLFLESLIFDLTKLVILNNVNPGVNFIPWFIHKHFKKFLLLPRGIINERTFLISSLNVKQIIPF